MTHNWFFGQALTQYRRTQFFRSSRLLLLVVIRPLNSLTEPYKRMTELVPIRLLLPS